MSSVQDLILELLEEPGIDWLSIRDIVAILSDRYQDHFRPKQVRESMTGLWNNRVVVKRVVVSESGLRVFVYRKA